MSTTTPRFTYYKNAQNMYLEIAKLSKDGYSELPSAKHTNDPLILIVDNKIKSYWTASEQQLTQSKELVKNKYDLDIIETV